MSRGKISHVCSQPMTLTTIDMIYVQTRITCNYNLPVTLIIKLYCNLFHNETFPASEILNCVTNDTNYQSFFDMPPTMT